MEIKSLKPNQSNGEILFESYLMEECESFDQLLEVYQRFKDTNLKKSIIITLDTLGQAEYTSTHAILANDLDSIEGYDLSTVDPVAFENGEHIGYLSTASEFFIRKDNFLKQTKNVDFSEACNRGLSIEPEEIITLQKVNNAPMEYLDKQIILKIVPVEKSYEAICGFPNGYFSGDLNPFENYALAKHLFEKYEYELFGIGASLIGFIKNSVLDEDKAEDLMDDLASLYDSEKDLFRNLVQSIKEKKYLFLKYTENLDL
jgi:hypothetical protein